MPVKITAGQESASIAAGVTADEAYANGIQNGAGTVVIDPIDGYAAQPTSTKDLVKSSFKQMFAIFAGHFSPIIENVTVSSPSFTAFTADTTLASLGITTYVARSVIVSLNLSAFTSITATLMGFRIKLNGSQVDNDLTYYFNAAADHRSMSGTWKANLGAGVSIITAHAFRVSGTGTLTLDANDIVTLSVVG